MTTRLLLSGGRGLIGSALSRYLASQAIATDLQYLSRAADVDGALTVRWDPVTGYIDADGLEGFDAVIHLAGETIASRWSKARKTRIRDSRVGGTALLAQALAKCARPPKTLICASAIGYYGDRGDEIVDEESAAGAGFLAEVVRDWEGAAAAALAAGIRVVHLRFGLVLSSSGGALTSMLLPFKLGLGGPLGSGRQYVSWVTLGDVVAVIDHVLAHDTIAG
ncbi:MAG: TIGR01777 family protein, partial [Gemmatimonadetes bacterium]|nr:TIGR01777 family protein [Gemmatimonadota bacterium]